MALVRARNGRYLDIMMRLEGRREVLIGLSTLNSIHLFGYGWGKALWCVV